ncbi:conserved hypothetical protein [Leishmania major strain Friedlin]|uniref:Uncharacterized protein n=1 Tax=Leishmania major TaxID=5664 RepID=E9AF53_LEIMA|nr:conserved hypothetical protein [Leishmania major strain Friedlin]CAG9582582.1 hypothetical_protein_-_conserved [Leishmania major strain Friedlin]CBZ12857.1 conserved hypothetical protein [Leishmania major strain Friedlin]|eukprot:XP_003722623.1 conserved hypothetical protein [Leishmania major strain Friedlin]
MLVFAVAADVAALRRAVAAVAGRATSTNYADELHREDGGAADQTSAAAGATRGVLSDAAWVFASVSGSCSLAAMPDSPSRFSAARYEAAAREMRQWQRLLSLARLPHLHAGVSCTSGPATRDRQANDATLRARASAAATEAVDESLSCDQHVDRVSSAESTEHSSLMWTHVPHTTAGAEFADFDFSRSLVCAARRGVAADVSPPAGHHLLCIDVGGVYLASSRTHHAAGPTQTAPPQPAEAAATKTAGKSERASRRPRVTRVGHGGAPKEQTASLAAHLSNVNAMKGERGAEASQGLWRLLQQRFATATRTCPFRTDAGATAFPLTLTEVWVIPLLTAERDSEEPLHSAALGLSAFPLLVQDEYHRNSADCAAAEGDSVQVVRLARHPPSHMLRLAVDDGAHSTDPSSSTMCQAAALRSRKRLRDSTAGRQDEAEGRQRLAAHATPLLPAAVFLHSCRCNRGGADPAAPEVSALRLRILERDFLLRSCYFSEWCCAADFDITNGFVSPHLGKWTRSATAYHAFYSALRRCVLAEDALVRHSIEEEAGKWVASFGSLSGTVVTSSSGAAAVLRSPTEALFKDSALEGRSEDDSGVRGSERVWPIEELWGLWVRLGWTPPLAWPRVRVCLRLSEGLGLGNVVQSSIWDLSPRALLALLSRVGAAVNAAYIEAKQLQPTHDPRGDCLAAEIESDGEAAGVALDRVSDPGRAHSCQERIPSSSAARCESSVQVQRLLEFQAALSVAPEFATGPVLAELSDFAVAAPCVPTVDSCAITAPGDAAGGFLVLSAAARDLAVDIAATRVLPTSHPVASPAGSVADVVALTVTWLRGVLESPALLILPLGVSGHVNERESADDSSGGAGAYPSRRIAMDKETTLLTALLARRSLFQPEKLLRGALDISSTSHSPQIAPPSSLSAAEMYCEVADVAELRWCSPQASTATATTTAYRETLSTAASQNPTLRSPSSVSSTASCCALACVELARLARTETADETVNECRTSHQQLSATNPLAAFLYTRFAAYLQEQGAVAVASPSGAGSSEGEAQDSGRDDEHKPRAACPARRSAVTVPSSSQPPMLRHEDCAQGGVATVSLLENGGCLNDMSGPSGDGDAVKTLLAETVVRVVQQNKSVVRRILALIQSYSGVIAAATAESNGGARCAASMDEAAMIKSGDTQPKDAVAQDLWRCLAPEVNGAMCVDEAASPVSSCAKAAARRLVQAFWENVAATARLHLRDRLGALSGREKGATSDSDEEESARRSASPPERRDGAANSPAEAAAPTSSGRQHSSAAKESGAEPAPAQSSTLSPSSREQVRASPSFPLLPSASLSRRLPSPNPVGQSYGALSQAVRALDGAQAMALYMQHILGCSNAAGRQQGQTRLGGCTLLSCVTEAPGRAPPTTVDTAATPARPQQPNHWLQHALFLLSYGLACPADEPVTSSATASTPANASAKGCLPVGPYQEADQLALPPPPALAAFRALRCAKISLDVYIGEALEVYVQRWTLSEQAR